MSFDPSRYPNAVTIGWLIAERMGMGVHCQKCARHVIMDPAKLHLAPETLVPRSPAASNARAAARSRPKRGRNGRGGTLIGLHLERLSSTMAFA